MQTELLPGIVYLPWDAASAQPAGGLIGISFCTQGRRMYHLPDCCLPLAPEHLLLCRTELLTAPSDALTGREQGFTLLVDPHRLKPELMVPFGCADAAETLSRLTGGCGYTVLSSAQITQTLRTFAENEISRRLRCLELLLLLQNAGDAVTPPTCTAEELHIAVSASGYALSRPQERITVRALAERAAISQTRLKDIFCRVYGMPVYRFLRTQKMHLAADLLRQTDRRVIDIASELSYDNPSKFAKAFAGVMGMPPSACRDSDHLEHPHE